mmetsp:Transcript_70549/g.165431  ORF Transcript_70549/g.165431 Transcript_70549/m.165431 type:complete len:193 (-) Transcript_70549:61-639(-)
MTERCAAPLSPVTSSVVDVCMERPVEVALGAASYSSKRQCLPSSRWGAYFVVPTATQHFSEASFAPAVQSEEQLQASCITGDFCSLVASRMSVSQQDMCVELGDLQQPHSDFCGGSLRKPAMNPVSCVGDFRSLPPSVWCKLHERFAAVGHATAERSSQASPRARTLPKRPRCAKEVNHLLEKLKLRKRSSV